jgi:N-formylglutamate amidohydrolase
MVEPYTFDAGTAPLLVSLPHGSTFIPSSISDRLTRAAKKTPDTDWHVERLYDFANDLGAGVIAATHSRYVIDLNRDPSGIQLYKNANNTELCPTTTFDNEPLYVSNEEPAEDEIAQRIKQYWLPYHTKLQTELSALKKRYGVAVLFDGHSIRSEVPRFYSGRIPDLNLGSANGASAAPDLAEKALASLLGRKYSVVWDERFTGGYITRRYGKPASGIHALQLELTWRNYMDEENYRYVPQRANRLKLLLAELLKELISWTEEKKLGY